MAIRFTAEFLVTARPTQAKIDLLVKQMKLAPEQVEMCIEADPSPNQTDYVTWIARWLSKGQIRLPEDAEGIRGNLAAFTTQKRQPGFQDNRDVNAYNPAQLAEVIQRNALAVVVRPKDLDKIRGLKGVSVLAQRGDITIFRIEGGVVDDPEKAGQADAVPDNVKALQVLSDSTEWCTRHEYARTYLKQGPSFVVFYRGQPYAQLHPKSNQFMNRSDHTLVKEYRAEGTPEREYRGWGHYRTRMSEGEFLGTAIPDPVANEALSLMRAKAPEVEEWAASKNVVSDPSVLAKRLKGTKHWLDAAVMEGVPISPEEEGALGSLMPGELEAYANKFHPEGRWAPMEKALLAHLKNTYDGVNKAIAYAATRIGGRWPEVEPHILRYATVNDQGAANALHYANQAVKGRWPELEARILKTKGKSTVPTLAVDYAIQVLKQPWRDVMPQASFKWGMAKPEALMCLNSPGEAIRYAEHFKFGTWPEFANVLQANNDLGSYIDYLDKVEGKKRDPHLEARLMSPAAETYREQAPLSKHERREWHWKHPEEEMPDFHWVEARIPKDALANLYTSKVLGQRWPDFEERMLREVTDKANSILPKDFRELEEDGYQSKDLPQPFQDYITNMVQGRWPEFEQALLQRYQDYPDTWKTNQALVASYIRTVAIVTKQTQEPVRPGAYYYSYQEVKPVPGIWPEGEAILGQRSPAYEEYLREDTKDGYEKYAVNKAEKERRETLPNKGNDLPYLGDGDSDLWHAGHQIRKYILFLRKHKNDWPDGVTLLNEIEDFRDKLHGRTEGGYHLRNRLTTVQGSLLRRLSSPRLLRPQRLPYWR
jgi:hypothetical protein